MDAFSPFADAIDAVESIMHWEEPKLTGALFVVYVFFVLYAWVIPGVLLVALLSLGWVSVTTLSPPLSLSLPSPHPFPSFG